ncbi:MAG: ABC transporter substrate-binding protein [Peptostreptococcaceae bacterium]
MSGAFVGGEADFTTGFEPTGTQLEKDGTGHIVASVGQDSGEIPYTAYCTTKSFMGENEDLLQRFTNAVYKGQLWVQSASAEEIAKSMQPFFNDMSLDDLVTVVDRYKEIDAWSQDPVLKEESLNKLMEVMDSAGELDKEPLYADIVNTNFATKAVENIK